jgi:hypothetical protein
MTKKYQVINNKYVVDKEAKLNGFYTCGDIVIQSGGNPPIDRDDCFKIIATIGEENRLEGLPVILFESLKDKYQRLATYWHMQGEYDKEHIFLGFIEQIPKGCWTDEDTLKAMLAILDQSKKSDNSIHEVYPDIDWAKKYLQSLK